MFKSKVAVIITVLIVLGIILVERISHVSSNDYQAYADLVEISQPSPQPDHYISKHQRGKSVKDYWHTKNDMRLNMHLSSEESELIFTNNPETPKIIENMKNITCVAQEELYYALSDGREVVKNDAGQLVLRDPSPTETEMVFDKDSKELVPMQKIRILKSAEGTYNYNTKIFSTNNAEFALLNAPGHGLDTAIEDSNCIMSGIATTVNFFLVERDFNFRAKHIKVKLHSHEGIS
ncbi:MAG: hypothetical protein ACQEP8_04090 [Chlamydiota bacterium]